MNSWIVIPAFNEESVIGKVIADVRVKFPNIIIVDDASDDRTADVAEQTGVVVLRHLINRGQGAALKTGIDYALSRGAEIIVSFDADGQHDANDIPKLVAPIQDGTHDVVLGSRFLQNESNTPPLRRFVLKLGVLFTRIMSRIRVTDTHNGLRAFSSMAAQKIKIVQDRMTHASEILDEIATHRLRYTEVPVRVTYSYYSKEKGQSNFAMFKIALRFILSKLNHR